MYQEEKISQRSEALVASLGALLFIVGTSLLLQSTRVLLFLLFLAALPFWLPYLVVRIRFRIWGRISGEGGIELPNKKFGPTQYKYLYNHPASSGRSKMSAFGLSDVFWYFLAPAHSIHQEHVENYSPKYKMVSRATSNIVLRPREFLEEMGRAHATELFESLQEDCEENGGMTFVYLRDTFFPMFARMYHELVFQGEKCPDDVCQMIVASSKDVIDALKFCKIRNMETRAKLTKYLVDRVAAGDCDHIFGEDELSVEEKALYLQGVIFHTGMVQMAEAIAHVALTLAQHSRVKKILQEDPTTDNKYLEWFLQETLRVYPLFGVAHRITEDDIPVLFDDGSKETVPKGSVLVFSHPAYQRTGYNRPNDFIPERWRKLKEYQCNFIPFGVKNNRPCPGRYVSWYWMREMTVLMVQNFDFFTCIPHTRSLPDGGKCILVSRRDPSAETTTNRARRFAWLTGVWALHKAQSVELSLVQFACGLYMLYDARKQQLCGTYFEKHDC